MDDGSPRSRGTARSEALVASLTHELSLVKDLTAGRINDASSRESPGRARRMSCSDPIADAGANASLISRMDQLRPPSPSLRAQRTPQIDIKKIDDEGLLTRLDQIRPPSPSLRARARAESKESNGDGEDPDSGVDI